MADFAVLYNATTGEVIGMWARTTSDNISTFLADDKLTVDGVDVSVGFSDSEATVAAVLVTDPTQTDTEIGMRTFEVDSVSTPTDVVALGTAGSRDEVYYGDNDPDIGIYIP